MKDLFYAAIAATLLLVSCGEEKKERSSDEKPSKEKESTPTDAPSRADAMKKEIAKLEKEVLENDQIADPNRADQLVALYASFAASFPKHEMAGDALFKGSSVAWGLAQLKGKDNQVNKGYARKVVELSKTLIDNYPNDPNRYIAFTMLTNILDFDLEEDDLAIEYYKKFMAEYPDREDVQETCKNRIENIDVPLDSLIKG